MNRFKLHLNFDIIMYSTKKVDIYLTFYFQCFIFFLFFDYIISLFIYAINCLSISAYILKNK